MTEIRQFIGFGDVERFLVKSYKSITGGREFDIEKYGPYVDAVKHILVPSLEKHIIFYLERFVYNEHLQQSSCNPHLSRYNDIATSIETMRDLLTIEHVVDFLENSLLTNSRLTKLVEELDGVEMKKNFLGYANVLNYINEKDFWIRSSSSSSFSSNTSRQCGTTVYSLSNDNMLEDVNALKGSCLGERARGHKRPRKRAATHINRKHYKLKQLARLSDESFRVTESLYDLLKSCSWDLSDSLKTKRRVKRNCDDFGRSRFADNRIKKCRKMDWKNGKLTLLIRKMNGSGIQVGEKRNRGNCTMVRTFLSLPCKVEQLFSRLDRVDFSSARSSCMSLIKKKFNNKLYNICSCLNDLLRNIDEKSINSIYLSCDIRDDYLHVKLKHMHPLKRNSSLFIARVPTCGALYRYGSIRKKRSPQLKLERRCFWEEKIEAKEPERVSHRGNMDFGEDEVISSIEISLTGCETNAEVRHIAAKGLTCDLKDFEEMSIRNSLSISDVVQKLELSPFRLKETEQSFKIRSKIRDLVRSIIICTRDHSSAKEKEKRSISIQAIISTCSLHEAERDVEAFPLESKSSKALSVSKVASIIESRIFPSKTGLACDDRKEPEKLQSFREVVRLENLSGSVGSERSEGGRGYLEAKERLSRHRGSVRYHKSVKYPEPPSSKESAKLNKKNKTKICETLVRTVKSRDFIGSGRCPLSNEILRSITSEISDALAAGSLNNDEDDYDIDVTVEIEDSSQSSDDESGSISRHTHILPSMKTVRLGTSGKYFPLDSPKPSFSSSFSSSLPSSSSTSKSRRKVPMFDNHTTMNKSMIPSSQRGTISAKSYDRIKRLIREKVRKKLSETDSCRPKSSKTVLSSGKYYLSIPSSKTSRVRLKREISESSSTSNDSQRLPIHKIHPRITTKTLSSSDDETTSRESSRCSCTGVGNSTPSSRAANFDKNSSYGCIEDRLANRYLADIVDDYSDEGEDSPRCKNIGSQISFTQFSNPSDSRHDFIEDSGEECWSSFGQGFGTDDDAGRINVTSTSEATKSSSLCCSEEKFVTTYLVENNCVQPRLKNDYFEKFDEIGRNPRATRWSTCAIRSSSSRDPLPEFHASESNSRFKVRDRGDILPEQKSIGSIGMIEKYKKRLKNIDRNLKTKLLRYVDFCKSLKSSFQRQICFDDVYETSRTSIDSNDLKRYKYSGIYFGD